MVAVDDAQPTLFLIDTAAGSVREEIVLKDVPKAAQIARYAPDNSLLGVTSLNSDTVSLIDPSFREQTAIKVGSQPMDMAFQGRHRLRVDRIFLIAPFSNVRNGTRRGRQSRLEWRSRGPQRRAG